MFSFVIVAIFEQIRLVFETIKGLDCMFVVLLFSLLSLSYSLKLVFI